MGRSFKTTNCIENLNSLIGNRTGKVDRWRNSEQKQRWLATAILDIEPRLRTVVGYRHLLRLRAALQSSSNRSGNAVARMMTRSRSEFQLEKGLTLPKRPRVHVCWSALISHYLNDELPRSRTGVEIHQHDLLPGAQLKLAVRERHR